MLLKQIAYLFCLCSLFGLVACGNSGTAASESGSSISISSYSESIFSSSEGAYSSSSVVSSSSVASLNTDPCAFTSTGTIHGTTGTLACTEKTYKTIVIGNQTWMAENLAWLPGVNAKGDDSYNEAKYYVSDYDGTSVSAAKVTSNYTTYGVLYNYEAALSACPTGWHLPTDAEWQTLEVYLGMAKEEAANNSIRGTDQGTQLKANSSLWTENTGTNTSGFTALPGGFYYGNFYYGVGHFAYFWTATTDGTSSAWERYLDDDDAYEYRYKNLQDYGLSVRCLKDSN